MLPFTNFLAAKYWNGSGGDHLSPRTSYTLTRAKESPSVFNKVSFTHLSAALSMTWTGSSDHPATSPDPM